MTPIYDFSDKQQFISIDKVPDFRSDQEKLLSPLSVYDHDNVDIAYAERLAEELVNICGAWITYFARTNNAGGVDEVWDEDADPTYKSGLKMKAFFAPKPIEIELTKWGVDAPNKTVVIFSRAVLIQTLGEKRLPRPGDVIEVPHNTLVPIVAPDGMSGIRMDKYRIINVQDTGMFKYRWLYYSATVESLTGDQTIQIEHR